MNLIKSLKQSVPVWRNSDQYYKVGMSFNHAINLFLKYVKRRDRKDREKKDERDYCKSAFLEKISCGSFAWWQFVPMQFIYVTPQKAINVNVGLS